MKKKVALLGDSIRLIGYGQIVPQMLGENYEVFQTEDNCRFAKYTLRMLFDYAEDLKNCDVIHWNNGLWDCTELFDDGVFTPEDEYVENMLRIAKKLKEITPNVIFATTTPTKNTYKYTHNDKISRYNEIIVPKLKEMGIVINDLNSLLIGKEDEMICDDEIHLSQKGAEICAEAVCKAIKQF
ncbi:MAG: SGNH/GDSL hydrolase family protein [Clostridiales bacterium]|nr:SGNH/GDSL hydrolase family protein [Clostridiales bacterium]